MVKGSQYIIYQINKFQTQTEMLWKISNVLRKINVSPGFRESENMELEISHCSNSILTSPVSFYNLTYQNNKLWNNHNYR